MKAEDYFNDCYTVITLKKLKLNDIYFNQEIINKEIVINMDILEQFEETCEKNPDLKPIIDGSYDVFKQMLSDYK